jgi:hypothetical protein
MKSAWAVLTFILIINITDVYSGFFQVKQVCSPAQSMNWREGGNYSAPEAHAFNYTRRQAVCTFEKTHAAH